MKSYRNIVWVCILCFPFLSACVVDYKAKVDALRLSLLPAVEKNITDAKLQPGAPSYIRIFKEEAKLEYWMRRGDTRQYQLYKTFPICSFSGALGPKLQEGDNQSPEGFYDVSEEWLWPGSKYHLAMNIGFPNTYDESLGRTGSLIMIHGGCESEGCYAMTDSGIEEIYLLIEQSLLRGQVSVPIHIFPFRMTNENMDRHKMSQWYDFWRNLKQGYDAFERQNIPPIIYNSNGRYIYKTEILVRRNDTQQP